MDRKTAEDFDQELLDLYDKYAHGLMERREFLTKAGKFAIRRRATKKTLLNSRGSGRLICLNRHCHKASELNYIRAAYYLGGLFYFSNGSAVAASISKACSVKGLSSSMMCSGTSISMARSGWRYLTNSKYTMLNVWY
jgi:hypothetical protein